MNDFRVDWRRMAEHEPVTVTIATRDGRLTVFRITEDPDNLDSHKGHLLPDEARQLAAYLIQAADHAGPWPASANSTPTPRKPCTCNPYDAGSTRPDPFCPVHRKHPTTTP
jgi:hypothetical protein